MTHTLTRNIVSEFVGSGFLVAAVVGSGILGERLAAGNVAIALLAKIFWNYSRNAQYTLP
jgi:hypothetical protein